MSLAHMLSAPGATGSTPHFAPPDCVRAGSARVHTGSLRGILCGLAGWLSPEERSQIAYIACELSLRSGRTFSSHDLRSAPAVARHVEALVCKHMGLRTHLSDAQALAFLAGAGRFCVLATQTTQRIMPHGVAHLREHRSGVGCADFVHDALANRCANPFAPGAAAAADEDVLARSYGDFVRSEYAVPHAVLAALWTSLADHTRARSAVLNGHALECAPRPSGAAPWAPGDTRGLLPTLDELVDALCRELAA